MEIVFTPTDITADAWIEKEAYGLKEEKMLDAMLQILREKEII